MLPEFTVYILSDIYIIFPQKRADHHSVELEVQRLPQPFNSDGISSSLGIEAGISFHGVPIARFDFPRSLNESLSGPDFINMTIEGDITPPIQAHLSGDSTEQLHLPFQLEPREKLICFTWEYGTDPKTQRLQYRKIFASASTFIEASQDAEAEVQSASQNSPSNREVVVIPYTEWTSKAFKIQTEFVRVINYGRSNVSGRYVRVLGKRALELLDFRRPRSSDTSALTTAYSVPIYSLVDKEDAEGPIISSGLSDNCVIRDRRKPYRCFQTPLDLVNDEWLGGVMMDEMHIVVVKVLPPFFPL